ncbi:hypothetical protein VPH35_123262 [Triticum aestivum]
MMREAGAWFPWQIHGIRGSWAERRMETRERRRKKGGEVRCPGQELAGAERRRTCAADGGIQSRPVGRHQPGQGWRTNEDFITIRSYMLKHVKVAVSFEGLMPHDLNIYVTTAANAEESSWGAYCPGM